LYVKSLVETLALYYYNLQSYSPCRSNKNEFYMQNWSRNNVQTIYCNRMGL